MLGIAEGNLEDLVSQDIWSADLKKVGRYKGGRISVQAKEADIGCSKLDFSLRMQDFFIKNSIFFTISTMGNTQFIIYKS